MRKILAMLIIVSFVFSGCGVNNEEETYPFYTTDTDVFEIETDYCNLYYPITWQNDIYIDIDDRAGYSVQFSGIVDEDTVPLFNINFGGTDGTKVGVLTVGNREVVLLIETFDIDEDEYSSSECKELRSMSEDVNVIISKLLEQYDFELVQK